MPRTYEVAAVQTHPRFGDVEGNLERAERLVEGLTADLIVFPELFSTGYAFRDRDELASLAEPWPDGRAAAFLARVSGRTKGVVIGGFAERAGDRLFNAAGVAVAGEPRLVYRKVHLFGFEAENFDAGPGPFPVLEHDGLRVGVMICFDWIYPEVARVLALDGADVIAHPSNLVLPWCQRAMHTRALENGVYAVTTNRIGEEARPPRPTLGFTGGSLIVDALGETLASAPPDEEAILLAEVDVARARDKTLPSGNDRLAERRPATYQRLTQTPR